MTMMVIHIYIYYDAVFVCHEKLSHSPSKLSAGGAKRDAPQALPSDDDGDGDDDDDDDDDDEDDDGDGGYRISVSSHARKKYHTQGIVVPLLASGKDQELFFMFSQYCVFSIVPLGT